MLVNARKMLSMWLFCFFASNAMCSLYYFLQLDQSNLSYKFLQAIMKCKEKAGRLKPLRESSHNYEIWHIKYIPKQQIQWKY